MNQAFALADDAAPLADRRPLMDWESFFRDYREPGFIAGYRVMNKLGSGVFGDVYRAEKISIGKSYAIKFLRLQDESLREPVLRELEAMDTLAQLDHPRLVTIEDRGEVCGIPFVVMGFAGEETLKHKLHGRPLLESDIAPVFRQVVEGVSALHQHGVVHFDLKPSNVFLRGDLVRVGDYGLSRLMSASRATLSMGRGTPHYMAPEMLKRRGDARSDVYSLGVILFEMLCGDVPFTGDSEWEILKRHEVDAAVYPPALPDPWRRLLDHCLHKDPTQRLADAGILLDAFDRTLAEVRGEGGPVLAPLPEKKASAANADRAGDAPRKVPGLTRYGRPEGADWEALEREFDRFLVVGRRVAPVLPRAEAAASQPMRWPRIDAKKLREAGEKHLRAVRGPARTLARGFGRGCQAMARLLRGAWSLARVPLSGVQALMQVVFTRVGLVLIAGALIVTWALG